MDGQAITTKSDLERILLDERMQAKALPLSLLKCITNNFSDEHKIGCGGFAVVYKGLLENQGEVAVKQLDPNYIDEKKFIGEVHCLMKVKHKNIVRFLGYCSDTQGEMVDYNGQLVMADVRQRLLCFEYVPKGTLDKYIEDASLEWGKCYKIIKGVCEGLHYLHKERIVHRDLKPVNILLDNDMIPKIADFGISKCFGESETHAITSKLIGSRGYLAPEFIFNGKITFKLDIYSLGIIIIEILTADKAYPEVDKVQEHWSHKLEGSQKELQLEQIRVCTEVAQSCLEYNPEKRPSAQTIINTLKRTEREERGIEPGASSHNPISLGVVGRDGCKSGVAAAAAGATPLGSTVAATNMSKKNHIRPFSHGPTTPDAETIAETIEMLMQAISKIYARKAQEWQDFSSKELHKVFFMKQELYRGVYSLVSHNQGEELYSAAENTMASEVQSLCRPLDDDAAPVDSTVFLHELLNKWDRHTWALQLICDGFGYMDLNFITLERKTPIYKLGLQLWRDEMARSDKIRSELIEAVKRQKGGEDELVPGVNKMLMELGADVKDKDNMSFLCFQDSIAGRCHRPRYWYSQFMF